MNRYASVMLTAAVAAFVSIATMIMVLPFGGIASQNNQYLPTTGTFSGLTAANTINNAIDSVNTCNSGSAAPANALGGSPKEGMCWLDTTSATAKILKRYTGSDWVVEGVLDVTNGRWQPPIGGGMGTVASAGTTDLCASPQSFITVSGTTTITSLGSSCVPGQQKMVVFSGALTLTHNATSLIIPGGANRTTAAGDAMIASYLGSGNWRVIIYVPLTAGVGVSSIDAKTGVFTTGNGIDSTGGNLIELTAARRTLPTTQVFTSGTATYTRPANVLWIEVEMVGGGAGGGGSGGGGGAGGATCWNTTGTPCTTPIYSVGGGAGSGPAAGGSVTGSSTCEIAMAGGSGQPSLNLNAISGAPGASSFFGGAGAGVIGGATGTGQSAATNSGSGGGGGAVAGGGFAGGAAGAYCRFTINSPAASYTYTVGAAGTGGASGGGSGGAGLIRVREFYGS